MPVIKKLDRNIIYLRIVGMSIITFGIVTAIIPELNIISLEFSLGGIGIGGILAWIIPFWLDPKTRHVFSRLFK